MKELIQYITDHTVRGACTCGKCCDAPTKPATSQSAGHTADMVFFTVALNINNPSDPKTLHSLILLNSQNSDSQVDFFNGQEHNYFEVGAWIGDQALALMLMGLGTLLGFWTLITPHTFLADATVPVSQQTALSLAETGYIAIRFIKE